MGVIAFCASAFIATAAIYDVEDDFSISQNPNGAWSYGYTATLGGGFNPYTTAIQDTFGNLGIPFLGFDQWAGSIAVDGNPSVIHNRLPVVNENIRSSLAHAPNDVVLHPGPNGEYSIARWTTPASDTFSFSATFSLIDSLGDATGPASTDVHVLVDGISVLNANLQGYGDAVSFVALLTLNPGQQVDFAVGFGSNAHFSRDSTRIEATISDSNSVPEASTWAAATALLSAAGWRYLRRR